MHFPDLARLAAKAWHEVKAEGDPEFNECAITHRENLVAAVQGAVHGGQAFNKFDAVVLRIYKEEQEEKSEAEKLFAQHPQAHADEIMHMASGLPHPLQGHAEDRQRALVREEFRGVADSFEAPVELESHGHAVIEPKDKSKTPPLKGTISVTKDAKGSTTATVNVNTTSKKKATKKVAKKKPTPKK